MEKKKETLGETTDRQQKKKLEREEEKLKNHNRDLSMVKMKSMFAIGITFTALLSMFNNMLVFFNFKKRFIFLIFADLMAV